MSAKKYLSNRKVGKNAQKTFQNGVESPFNADLPDNAQHVVCQHRQVENQTVA